MWHGTSLRVCDNPVKIMDTQHEVGLAFVTSPRLATCWKQYTASNYEPAVLEAIQAKLSEDGHDTDDEDMEEGDYLIDCEEMTDAWWNEM